MRVLKNISQHGLAAALLAFAVQSALADGQGMSYTWVEGGVSRVVPSINSKSVDMDGGYLRGSFAIGDNFYLLGGYSQNDGKWKKRGASSNYVSSMGTGWYDIPGWGWEYLSSVDITEHQQTTTKGKEKLSQAELGFGFRLPVTERIDAVAELLGMHWEHEGKTNTNTETDLQFDWNRWGRVITTRQPQLPTDVPTSSKSRVWGGKALVGLRAQPFDALEVWAKGGYLKMRNKDNSLVEQSVLGNLGVQFRITDNFGVVGEADIFEKDVNQYRVGMRFSF